MTVTNFGKVKKWTGPNSFANVTINSPPHPKAQLNVRSRDTAVTFWRRYSGTLCSPAEEKCCCALKVCSLSCFSLSLLFCQINSFEMAKLITKSPSRVFRTSRDFCKLLCVGEKVITDVTNENEIQLMFVLFLRKRRGVNGSLQLGFSDLSWRLSYNLASNFLL